MAENPVDITADDRTIYVSSYGALAGASNLVQRTALLESPLKIKDF
jgi:hypothetical protein